MGKVTREINEVSTWEDWRQYEEGQVVAEVTSADDADNVLENGTVWVESASTTNLPTGMTKGFLTTSVMRVNGVLQYGQLCYGVAGSFGRYQHGTAGWSAWV